MKPYYEEDGITLYCGDCREILPQLKDKGFDLCLTDPPYGVSWQSNWRNDTFEKIVGDDSIRPDWIAFQGIPILYCFSRWDVLQRWIDGIEKYGYSVRDVLVWDKLSHGAGDLKSYAPTYELIIYATKERVELTGKRPQNVLRYWRVDAGATGKSSGELLCHPAQKPTALLKSIISNHGSQSILDPFCGSGTTLIAAKQLGCEAVGIEISEKYCEIAVKRLSQMQLDFK